MTQFSPEMGLLACDTLALIVNSWREKLLEAGASEDAVVDILEAIKNTKNSILDSDNWENA